MLRSGGLLALEVRALIILLIHVVNSDLISAPDFSMSFVFDRLKPFLDVCQVSIMSVLLPDNGVFGSSLSPAIPINVLEERPQ